MADGPSGHRGRHRGRRGVIRQSLNRDEYEGLIAGGWSSLALERYALARYGEDIPASTFRRYRDWLRAQGRKVVDHVQVKDWDPERILDVITSRQELVMMQQDRLRMQIRNELVAERLLSGTAAELRLLDDLLTKLKADFQELGIYPTRQELDDPKPPPPPPAAPQLPAARRLADVFGELPSRETEIQIARLVAAGLPDPPTPGQPQQAVLVLDQAEVDA